MKSIEEFVPRAGVIVNELTEAMNEGTADLREAEGRILDCEIGVDQAMMVWLVNQIDGDSTGARSVQRLVEATVSRTIGNAFLRGAIEPGKHYELTLDGDQLEVVATTKGGQDT